MRRLLMICPSFPPTNDTSSRRAAGLAKYLAKDSWHVTVLTRKYGNPDRLEPPETAYRLSGIAPANILESDRPYAPPMPTRLSRALVTLKNFLILPGACCHRWCEAALEKLPPGRIGADVIWATYPGEGPLLTADRLSRRWGVPWIADFRDLPCQRMLPLPGWVRGLAMSRLKGVCRSASCWVTVSEPMAEALRGRFAGPIEVIPNGYDPELFHPGPAPPGQDVFRIAYTGSITATRDPMPVVEAVAELIDDGSVPAGGMEIAVYGRVKPAVLARAAPHLGRILHLHQHVPVAEVARQQRRATALLLLSHPGAPGVLTGKLFEYMASGRPVIACRKDPSIDAVLTATGIGVSCNLREQAKAVLLDWYRQWRAGGDIAVKRCEGEIGRYSRLPQARRLGALLERAVAGRVRPAPCPSPPEPAGRLTPAGKEVKP